MALISIIIPCHNSANTIVQTLESLRTQEFKDYEVVVIDDTSTDDTINIIKKYRENTQMNIRLLVNKVNLGPGGSRNVGIVESKGKYIGFMDSDDTVVPEYFERIVDSINKGADLVTFIVQLVIGGKCSFTKTKYHSKGEQIALSSGTLCQFIAKKELWDNLELPPIKNAEDIAVVPTLIYRAKHIINLDIPLYNYIYYPNSGSSKVSKQVVENFKKSFEYTISHFPKDEYQDSIEFHGIKTILYGATLNAIKVGYTSKEIETIILEFEKNWPNWCNNPYVKKYTGRKKFYLKMIKTHQIWAVRIFVKLQELYLKVRG